LQLGTIWWIWAASRVPNLFSNAAPVGPRNGSATGITRIFGTADVNHAMNIVYMGDGFVSSEQTAFNNLCTGFVNFVTTFPPFSNFLSKINIYRINCISNTSGLNFTTTPNNYLSTYLIHDPQSGNPSLQFLDPHLAPLTAATFLPQYSAFAVVMNSNVDVGTMDGSGCYFSGLVVGNDAGCHEFGHLIFDLSDEYGNPGQFSLGGNVYAGTPAIVSPYGNVAHNASPFTGHIAGNLPWANLITGSPVPILPIPDCNTFNQTNTLGNAVGAFESAQYWNCGVYRGQYVCKMRFAPNNPYCAVCSQRATQILAAV
jgi:IgA Peptidase M64